MWFEHVFVSCEIGSGLGKMSATRKIVPSALQLPALAQPLQRRLEHVRGPVHDGPHWRLRIDHDAGPAEKVTVVLYQSRRHIVRRGRVLYGGVIRS